MHRHDIFHRLISADGPIRVLSTKKQDCYKGDSKSHEKQKSQRLNEKGSVMLYKLLLVRRKAKYLWVCLLVECV